MSERILRNIETAFQGMTVETKENQRLKIPKTRRLRSSLDFAKTYALKQKAGNAYLLIFAARQDSGKTRIGLSVSKKNGNSVERHRIRRLLKEAYRLEQHSVPEGLDLILIPRPGSKATIDDYRKAIVLLSRKLAQRIPE